jgi:hypothetical protein
LAFLKEQKDGQNIKRLRIIPDGALGYLPFEMLLTNNTSKQEHTLFALRTLRETPKRKGHCLATMTHRILRTR